MSKIIGTSLTQDLVELFNKRLTTVIVSTVSEDGYPHAMPVHLLTAIDDKTLRMALMKSHETVQNLKQNEKMFVTVADGPDIAVGIKGTAKVIKDSMEENGSMCMIQFSVEELKSDTTPTVIVLQGIHTVHRTNKTEQFFNLMFEELSR